MQPSKEHHDSWVCTDRRNGIVCRFSAHKFNSSQEFTFLEDIEKPDALSIARIMREMGDWLKENHYDKIF